MEIAHKNQCHKFMIYDKIKGCAQSKKYSIYVFSIVTLPKPERLDTSRSKPAKGGVKEWGEGLDGKRSYQKQHM